MKRIALFFCFIFSFAAHANNIIVNGTRFIYPGNEGNDSNLLIVFYVQIMPDDFVMQLHRF
ncbi:pili assembly chaperone [Klebsiella pneumoniae]|nr:pili assembly chaperone [Klebsiella pneumoniae]